MSILLAPPRYTLSLGSAFLRLWERERGLLAEIPPCIVVEKESGEVRLYGEEAAALEGRVPPHLEFHRLWWADKIIDRVQLRAFFQFVLLSGLSGPLDRWRRPWQTQILVSESMSVLHRRWLLRTAQEAGWWLPQLTLANLGLLRENVPGKMIGPAWKVQAFLDLGFSQARLIVYLGDEILLASATESFSLQRFCQSMAGFLYRKHQVVVSPSHFYDQNWTRTRLVFHEKKQKPMEWSVESGEYHDVQVQFWTELSDWVEQELNQLETVHRSEIEQRDIQLLGGGAGLWFTSTESEKTQGINYGFRKMSDAPYAQLRGSLKGMNNSRRRV